MSGFGIVPYSQINTFSTRVSQPSRITGLRSSLLAARSTIPSTRNELRILAHLMQHAGEIVSRADLIDVLWDNQIYIDDNTLSVNMTRLRGKLGELGLPDYIRTRRGLGYQCEKKF